MFTIFVCLKVGKVTSIFILKLVNCKNLIIFIMTLMHF